MFERKSDSSYEAVQSEDEPHEVTRVSLEDPIKTLYDAAHSVIAESLVAEDSPVVYDVSLHEVRDIQNLRSTPCEPLAGERKIQCKIHGSIGDTEPGTQPTSKANVCLPHS